MGNTKATGVAYADPEFESVTIGGNTLTGSEFAALDGVSAGTAAASKAVVLGASRQIATVGAITGDGDVSIAKTLTGTTVSTERLMLSAITLNPASTVSVTGGGSLAGVRGEVVLSASRSFTDGFLYGAQGKITLNGTMAEASAARAAGVIGQVDLSTGTLTKGQVSALWGDLQGNPTLTVNDQLYCGRFTNSMSAGKKAQAFQLMYGAADYFVEAAADGGTADWVVAAAVGGSQTHKLKVNIMGTDFYIPLNTA